MHIFSKKKHPQNIVIKLFKKNLSQTHIRKSKLYEIFNSKLDENTLLNIPIYNNNTEQTFIYETELINTNLPMVKISSLDNLDKIFLIVDFPNLGGGTSFFLKAIISKYQNCNNFLIARNFDDKISFNINEKYELEKKYNNDEAVEFLNSIQNKITKVFVNHKNGHKQEFIKSLFTLNKEVFTISHDFINFFKNYQISYKQIINEKIIELSDNNPNSYNKIITQNIINAKIIAPFIDENEKIIVSELPDFLELNAKIEFDNKELTVIGLIGMISLVKGENILKKIIDYYNNSQSVKIIIFGKCNIENFNNNFEYKSIEELNNLLILHKPNVLLELSVWPETYSYTLSLVMITQLPVLYFEKPFESVIENRLQKYNNAHSFNSIDNLNELIVKVKQNYLFTIEPKIFFNSFWDEYFGTSNLNANEYIPNDYILNNYNNMNLKSEIENKNIVLITSKIYVSQNAFSYCNNRSIYTPEERFEQTMLTIESIKKYIPDCYIILFDNSKFINKYFDYKINSNVDLFLNIVNNERLNYYTDICEFKAFSELSQLTELYKLIFQNIDFSNIKNLFKITGRYTINEKFDYSQYDNVFNIIKKNEFVTDRDYWYTSFYKVNKSYIHDFFSKLQVAINDYQKYKGFDIEVIFSEIFKNDFKLINNLGIKENIAVWNQVKNI